MVGNNALVDGLEALDVGDDGGGDSGGAEKSDEGVITQLAGVSKKGYAPYNPRKKNQDALAMCVRRRIQPNSAGRCNGRGGTIARGGVSASAATPKGARRADSFRRALLSLPQAGEGGRRKGRA